MKAIFTLLAALQLPSLFADERFAGQHMLSWVALVVCGGAVAVLLARELWRKPERMYCENCSEDGECGVCK